MNTDKIIKDSVQGGWVERMPTWARPYLRLSRYDRPIGFWLLALPGWIGLCFAALSTGFVWADIKWAVLIGIGAVAMRGAGCTYNDIVDRDLDKQVERTALRPLAAGTISLKSAWIWLALQCLAGLALLAFFPRLTQIIAVSSLALVAAYPFMKRITYWPQAWLGLTFNWAVLVAYTAKTGHVSPSLLLYAGLVFWTIGYDTIYACQDVEDDALIGVKSTARLFGNRVRLGVGICYVFFTLFVSLAIYVEIFGDIHWLEFLIMYRDELIIVYPLLILLSMMPTALVSLQIVRQLDPSNSETCLVLFKRNMLVALILIFTLLLLKPVVGFVIFNIIMH